MTPAQLAARNAAIRLAWDDPLLRAQASAAKMKPGSKLLMTREEYNAWYRDYLKKWRAKRKNGGLVISAVSAEATVTD